MKYIHHKLSNLIGQFERTMVQVHVYVFNSLRFTCTLFFASSTNLPAHVVMKFHGNLW